MLNRDDYSRIAHTVHGIKSHFCNNWLIISSVGGRFRRTLILTRVTGIFKRAHYCPLAGQDVARKGTGLLVT